MTIAGIPLFLGMMVNSLKPPLASALTKGLKPISFLIFLSFVVFALAGNWSYFLGFIGTVFLMVFLHNALGLAGGYYFAAICGVSQMNRRTIAIETGIQNSGLGLLVIFSFFNGNGGMAILAAWWGIWHIVSGLGLSFYWRNQKRILEFQ